MKRLLIAGAMMALMIVPQANVWADGDEFEEFTPAQREQIRKMIQDNLRGGGMTQIDPPTLDLSEQMPALGDTKQQVQRFGDTFTGGSGLQGGRTIYAKPFVKAPKTIVGGYIDFIVTDCAGAARDCRDGLEFDQERFVPFFYSQVTDRVSVAVELEIEHGGPQGNQGDGDVKIEFATMDYRIEDWINLRGGILLVPMGRFNLIHDTPLNDLPLRPMVSRLIIPSTFAESGLGLYGTFYPTRLSKVDYEFYITQGFDGSDTTTTDTVAAMTGIVSRATSSVFTAANGLRSIRGSLQTDNNDNKAIVSRIAVSPILGVEVAGSIHHGTWDDADNNYLTILAVDGNLQRGPFEIQGEAAWVNIEGGNTLASSGLPPARMEGFYVQGNYHFMPEFLQKMAPTHFSQGSTFTAIVRYGEADTNANVSNNTNDLKRVTFGVNFRPVEDSVIKFAYTINDEAISDSRSAASNNGWQFGAATYF
ncbi:hypothetical protein [Candidatus Nitronereus thalassa]|uniref:Porin n=1 Tax=Candidatus Nitronereus thalassa TaxID=3020898 RepID=A0ABU3K364_9BACT|nr:hypothetical protein [Candidatus Nitronereus thalassa]MDT7040814.1 hypothetical protein [Candidatus Nitronereus thalassa]